MRWFGQPWPSGVCDGPHVETPVGYPCAWCEEPIAAGDSGVVIPSVRLVDGAPFGSEEPWHKECFLRSAVGSVGHLTGTCSCRRTGDEVFEDPPGLTMREAAVEVWTIITTGGWPLSARPGC